MTGLDEEILWLADLVMRRYAPEGIPIERADCRTGQIVHDRFLLDELGDFLQNVAAITPLLGNPDPVEWALALVRRTRSPRFRRDGLFESFAFATARWRRIRGLGLAFPFWNLDSLTGLVGLYEVAKELGRAGEAGEVGQEIAKLAGALLGSARAGRLRYGFHPATGAALPFSSPQITGYVAEELIRYGRLSGEARWIDAGASLLRAECETPGFVEHGIFCAGVHGPAAPALRLALQLLGKRHFVEPLLMKDNTLPAFALLALAAASPEHAAWALAAAERWRAAVDAWFWTPSGDFVDYGGSANRRAANVRLTFNHSIIEWDIEAFAVTGRRPYLDRAARLAGRWVALQTGRGLFPEGPEAPWRARSLLDAQVDLSVNLLKLSDLTGDPAWERAGRENFAAIRRDFRLSAGYAWEVDSETGEVREPVVEVKYLGLLLKGYLGLRAVARGTRLSQSPLLWALMRDR